MQGVYNSYIDFEGAIKCISCHRLCNLCYGGSNNDCKECTPGIDLLKVTRCACLSGYFDDMEQEAVENYCQPCDDFCRDCYYKRVRQINDKCLYDEPGYFIYFNQTTSQVHRLINV
jgi:hypothetical protein